MRVLASNQLDRVQGGGRGGQHALQEIQPKTNAWTGDFVDDEALCGALY